jgi:type II secretion system-associated lipoprotein
MLRLSVNLIVLLAIVIGLSCKTFITADDKKSILDLGNGRYSMIKDLSIRGKTLKKGDEVRLIITMTSDWIKVNARPLNEDELKSKRLLILYVFKDEFSKGIFNFAAFRERLMAIVKPI